MHRTMGIVLLAACSLESTGEIESSALTPPLSISPRATAIGEAGDPAFIKISMTARPKGPVTVALSSNLPGEAQFVPSSVTFTPRDWSTAQTIEVVPIDDTVFDGDVTVQVEARIVSGAYAGYLAYVDVLSVDDDYDITGFNATKFLGDNQQVMPVAINNRGQIIFDLFPSNAPARASLWDNGTITDLHPITDQETRARSINDAGAVLGSIRIPGPGTFVYQDGVVRPGQADTWAINELDHEAGNEFLCTQACNPFVDTEVHPFNPTAQALNNHDQVTGRYPTGPNGAEGAFYWEPGPGFGSFTELGGHPRGEGLDINEHGAAVGQRFDASFNYQPFLYANGTITELGTATGEENHAVGGVAAGINDRGDIAGSDYDSGRLPIAGWIGRPGNLRSIQSLLVDGTCFMMLEVIDINNSGQIIARGWECNVGTPYAFRFDPIKTAR